MDAPKCEKTALERGTEAKHAPNGALRVVSACRSVGQLETQLSEFAGVVDNPNPQQEHQIKALQSDLESAQNNVSSLQKQLDDLMD